MNTSHESPEDIDHSNFDHATLTQRQYAAIHLQVPDSGEPWLDDMIRQSLRDYFAGQALAGMLANETSNQATDEEVAITAYNQAHAML